MWLGGGRRLVFLSVQMGLLVISLLFVFMWVCSNSCRVGPISIHHALTHTNTMSADAGNSLHKLNLSSDVVLDENNMSKSKQQLLLRKYFTGRRAFAFAAAAAAAAHTHTNNAFHDSKRRVPSCPDPLHN